MECDSEFIVPTDSFIESDLDDKQFYETNSKMLLRQMEILDRVKEDGKEPKLVKVLKTNIKSMMIILVRVLERNMKQPNIKKENKESIESKSKVEELVKEAFKKVKRLGTTCVRCKTDSHTTDQCFNFITRIPKYINIIHEIDNLQTLKNFIQENRCYHVKIYKGMPLQNYDISSIKELKEKGKGLFTVLTDSLGEFNKLLEILKKKTTVIKLTFSIPQWSELREKLVTYKEDLKTTWFPRRFWLNEKKIPVPLTRRTLALLKPTETKTYKELSKEQLELLNANRKFKHRFDNYPTTKEAMKSDRDYAMYIVKISKMRENCLLWKELNIQGEVPKVAPKVIKKERTKSRARSNKREIFKIEDTRVKREKRNKLLYLLVVHPRRH